jgi:hypothetical protein
MSINNAPAIEVKGVPTKQPPSPENQWSSKNLVHGLQRSVQEEG